LTSSQGYVLIIFWVPMRPGLSQILSFGEYFGRILAAGLIAPEKAFLLYGITGRSPASRARRLVSKPEGIFTEPLPEVTLTAAEKELLVYPAILFSRGVAASNGRQTEAIAAQLASGEPDPVKILKEALKNWDYEPDFPTFTPRISGCFSSAGQLAMSLIRRGENGQSIRDFWPLVLRSNQGYLLATYNGENRQPLLAFSGSPLKFSVQSSTASGLLAEFYQALGPKEGKEDWRVAAVAVIFSLLSLRPIETEVINRY